MWRNDIKCKYMFMFSLKNLARKGWSHVIAIATHSKMSVYTPSLNELKWLYQDDRLPGLSLIVATVLYKETVSTLTNWPLGRVVHNNFRNVISQHMLQMKLMSTSEIAVRWVQMPQNTFDDKWTLVKLMAWYRHATSHYLSQCWPGPMSPYGITRLHRGK